MEARPENVKPTLAKLLQQAGPQVRRGKGSSKRTVRYDYPPPARRSGAAEKCANLVDVETIMTMLQTFTLVNQVFTCKNRLRYSRERVLTSLLYE